ncbi:MAG: histidine phosphatase family protein [Alphaproteobacteria bacterium]|nr:histidine phosphatase family protein [Alphaproteobacteria bacterium]
MVARVYLVRHGKAAATFAEATDPGLDDRGREQAIDLTKRLAPLGPLPVLVSPLRRTRETALPLCQRWEIDPVVERRVAEIPSRDNDLQARTLWLRGIMGQRWGEVEVWLQPWRQGVIDCLVALPRDTVVVSHFIAINVAVGAATGDDRVVGFRPDNCSCTILQADGSHLTLLERGREGQTTVL